MPSSVCIALKGYPTLNLHANVDPHRHIQDMFVQRNLQMNLEVVFQCWIRSSTRQPVADASQVRPHGYIFQ